MKKNTHKKLVKNAIDLEQSMRKGLKTLKQQAHGFPVHPKQTTLFERVLKSQSEITNL